jgi:hypothetical protein
LFSLPLLCANNVIFSSGLITVFRVYFVFFLLFSCILGLLFSCISGLFCIFWVCISIGFGYFWAGLGFSWGYFCFLGCCWLGFGCLSWVLGRVCWGLLMFIWVGCFLGAFIYLDFGFLESFIVVWGLLLQFFFFLVARVLGLWFFFLVGCLGCCVRFGGFSWV